MSDSLVPRLTARLPMMASAGAAFLGAVALVGWAADIALLRSLMPGAPPMVPNTALSLVLLSVTLVLIDGASAPRHRAAAAAIAMAVAAFGALTILEHALGVMSPTDLLFFATQVRAIDGVSPGRAGLATGLALLAVGASHVLIALRDEQYLEQARAAAASALVMSLAAAVNGLYESPARVLNAPNLGMALPTAVALGILAAGSIALRPHVGVMTLFQRRGPAGYIARRLIPATILAPPLLAGVVVLGRFWGWYSATVAVSLIVLLSVTVLLSLIVRQVVAMARLEDARDVAERREATTFHLAAVGVAHFGLDGRLLRANERFVSMYRVDPSQVVGVNWHDFVIGERIPSAETLLELERGTIPSVQVERPFRRGDGTEFWVRLSVSVARGANGEADYHIVVADDITERRRLEMEARELEQRMERVARLESISVLAGGVAHDFNNILAAILGNASFARDGLPYGSPLAAHLEEVERAARRAADLTGKLLAYAGKTERRPAPLRLDELAADASDVFTSSMQSRLAVWIETADPVWVRGDLAQLRQAALTLMTNAAEALNDRSHGRITVRAGVATLSGSRAASSWWPAPLEDGQYGYLEVADDGPGIEPRVMEQLFVPFSSTKFLGRGLGLAAALGITRAHRGAMEVESAPGRGSAFRIWLPLITPEDEPPG